MIRSTAHPLASTALAATLALGGVAFGQDHQHFAVAPAGETAYAGAAPPLFDDLGTLSMPVSASHEAQRFFDQGLRLAYGFNHAEARRAFRQAQRLDPDCAMCFWGEALVLGPNINAPMMPEDNAPALAALARAQDLAAGAGEREQALIAALATRYSDAAAADRRALDAAYAEAMAEVAARFPDDQDIATLTAEAMMDTQPWDYWQAGGAEPKGYGGDIVRLLEGVLAANPDHFGAIHLYIHAVEASDRPERAEPHADRMAAMNLGTGHLVHMPAHIYFRIGRYLDSLELNKQAVAVDEAFIEQTGATGLYPAMYYPHNVHFVLASAQMAGDAETALEAADKLATLVTPDIGRAVPPAQPIQVAPYFAYAQFGDPAAVLAMPEPPDDLPFPRAMWHYARGVALAAQGDLAAAEAEAEAIAALAETADLSPLLGSGVPADQVMGIAREVVLARVAQAKGDLDAAIGHFEAAATAEEGLPYMEPAYWYYPVRQSLGAVLLKAGRVEEAEAAFRASLARVPNSGWSCFGLMEAAKARGDEATAEEAAERLDHLWIGDRALLDLQRL